MNQTPAPTKTNLFHRPLATGFGKYSIVLSRSRGRVHRPVGFFWNRPSGLRGRYLMRHVKYFMRMMRLNAYRQGSASESHLQFVGHTCTADLQIYSKVPLCSARDLQNLSELSRV